MLEEEAQLSGRLVVIVRVNFGLVIWTDCRGDGRWQVQVGKLTSEEHVRREHAKGDRRTLLALKCPEELLWRTPVAELQGFPRPGAAFAKEGRVQHEAQVSGQESFSNSV